MEMSVRVPKDWTLEQVASLKTGMYTAFRDYVDDHPLSSKHEPQVHFEVFPAVRPFTQEGDVRGLTDAGINEWWHHAIMHLMQFLQKEFHGRGITLYTTREGRSYNLPQLDSFQEAA